MLGEIVSPGIKLTVIIRNDSPLIHCGDHPSYRTVTVNLTEEQEKSLGLRCTGMSGGQPHYESISQIILEEP